MTQFNAIITGIGASLPDYIMTNDELAQLVNTSDEWIMSRIGIKQRHILKGKGKGTSDMGAKAVDILLDRTNTLPEEVDMLICATLTPDMQTPATANIICDKVGIMNAFSFDVNAACSGFLYALTIAEKFIASGSHKKIVVVGAEKMSSVIDYTDRAVSPIFGDGAGAIMLEPAKEKLGIIDSILCSDGSGGKHLYIKAGGSSTPASHETVDAHEHYVYQEGTVIFKAAVLHMADVSISIMKKNNLLVDDLDWFVPHQANIRIIDATTNRLKIDKRKVMINIQKYGNTTAGTIPLCLWDYENQIKKGDKLILSSFGAGFTWGSIYMKWGYNSK